MGLGTLFKHHWQIEKLQSHLWLRSGLGSASPLSLIIILCNQMWWVNRITVTLRKFLLDYSWIFLKDIKHKKIELVRNKANKLFKLNFQNKFLKQRLDDFVQTDFSLANIPQYCVKLVKVIGVIYKENFETFIKS